MMSFSMLFSISNDLWNNFMFIFFRGGKKWEFFFALLFRLCKKILPRMTSSEQLIIKLHNFFNVHLQMSSVCVSHFHDSLFYVTTANKFIFKSHCYDWWMWWCAINYVFTAAYVCKCYKLFFLRSEFEIDDNDMYDDDHI